MTAPAELRPAVRPLAGADADYDGLLELATDARLICLGEASHGTHDFYRERARITKRLIRERAITALAVEADWPDAYRVNCYVRGASDDRDAGEALGDFRRFPEWMWRNADVRDFVEWLRAHNDALPAGEPKVGFYGLDIYSLHSSIDAVLRYLERVDPEAAERARERYACFDHRAARGSMRLSCEDEAVEQLAELRRRAADYARRDGRVPADAHFFAEQNARLVESAERYDRALLREPAASWNLRDHHMADTLDELLRHLERDSEAPRLAVWEHNSRVGDARATEMWDRSGELNVGQLLRERHRGTTLLVGFTTYEGTVMATSAWGLPGERMKVRPALDHSYEALFHGEGDAAFVLDLRSGGQAVEHLRLPRLERAIGVVYRPHSERESHWFSARLPDQFDAVVHLDRTSAVEPLG